jgi:hypothetical protein
MKVAMFVFVPVAVGFVTMPVVVVVCGTQDASRDQVATSPSTAISIASW